MMREIVVLVALVMVVMALTGCAADLGHGKVYGSTVPHVDQTERVEESRVGSLAVYGFAYPRGDAASAVSAVSAPSPDRRGMTVYGFEYPRND